MEKSEITTDKTLAGTEQNVPASDGGAAEVGTTNEEVLDVHVLLNRELGKDFKDDQTAIKSVKDTFNFVGKAGKYLPLLEKLEQIKGGESEALKIMEDIINKPQAVEGAPAPAPAVPATPSPEVADEKKYLTVEQVADILWLRDNPEVAGNKKVLDAFALLPENKGKSLREIAESDDFKRVTGTGAPVTGNNPGQSKSVIHSNSRVAGISQEDYQSDLKSALESGRLADFLAKHKGIEIKE